MRTSSLPLPALLLALLVATTGCVASAQEGPTYANAETKTVIEKMIEAHGGLASWQRAHTLGFEHILHIPNGPWMVHREVVHLKNRQTYQDWPLLEATIAFDGEKTWTEGWPQQMMPPTSAVYAGFHPTAVVWLTQDAGVKLDAVRKGAFPIDVDQVGGTYFIVRMQYSGAKDYYDLYIDQETYLLRGFETIVTYGGLLDSMGLPPAMTFWGPMFHAFRTYGEADGLIYPEYWITTLVNEQREIGQHLILNPTLNVPFDTRRMQMPNDAVVDTSTAERQTK